MAKPMIKQRNTKRMQSAIEYLSTYSLSILTISVIIGIIYFMGLFNFGATSAAPSVCSPIAGFSCSGGTINTGGAVSFAFGISQAEQGQGPISILAIGCSNSTAAPTTGWSSAAVNVSPLMPGQIERAIAPCSINGAAKIGTPFSGTLWLQYMPESSSSVLEAEVGKASYTTSATAQPSSSAAVSGLSIPEGMAYDPQNGDMYIAIGAGALEIVSGSTIIGSISGLSAPIGVAYDPSDGYIYAANEGDGAVSVVSGTILIANVPVQVSPEGDPEGLAYDPSNGDMYVLNILTQTASILSGTTLIGNVPMQTYPGGIAYDPSDGYMYVTNGESNTVSVFLVLLQHSWQQSPGLMIQPGSHIIQATVTCTSQILTAAQ